MPAPPPGSTHASAILEHNQTLLLPHIRLHLTPSPLLPSTVYTPCLSTLYLGKTHFYSSLVSVPSHGSLRGHQLPPYSSVLSYHSFGPTQASLLEVFSPSWKQAPETSPSPPKPRLPTRNLGFTLALPSCSGLPPHLSKPIHHQSLQILPSEDLYNPSLPVQRHGYPAHPSPSLPHSCIPPGRPTAALLAGFFQVAPLILLKRS